eukprot:gene11241-12421_t
MYLSSQYSISVNESDEEVGLLSNQKSGSFLKLNDVPTYGLYNRSDYMQRCHKRCRKLNDKNGEQLKRLLWFGGESSKSGDCCSSLFCTMIFILPLLSLILLIPNKHAASLHTKIVIISTCLAVLLLLTFWHAYSIYVIVQNKAKWLRSWFTVEVSDTTIPSPSCPVGTGGHGGRFFDIRYNLRYYDITKESISSSPVLDDEKRKELMAIFNNRNIGKARLILYKKRYLRVFANASFIGKFLADKDVKGSKLNVLHKPQSVVFSKVQKPILFHEVTSILSLALGFSVPKEIQWKGLQSGNPFNRPNAIVMFTVDSMPVDADMKVAHTNQFSVKASSESSRLEMLALSSKKSLCDHISEIYNGKSSTLSLSASEELAAAGYSDGERSQTVFWNEKQNAWVLISKKSPKGEVLFTKLQLIKEMKNIFNSDDIKYIAKKKSIVVSTKTADVSFDLERKADWMFFGELAMTHLVSKKIASKAEYITDGVPDVYMFGITGLKDLQKKYGTDSIQVRAAIKVLETFIPEVSDKFVKLYKGNILAVELTLKKNEAPEIHDTKDTRIIYDHVKKHLGQQSFDQFHKKFPELHVFEEMEQKAKKSLCQQLSGLVSKFGVEMKFKCASDNEHHKLSRRSLLSVKVDSGLGSNINLASLYHSSFPIIFNIWFWLLVVLALVVYVICLVMWYMDPGRDSIIYRMTNQRIKMD